ncbi:DUF6049 family protein [Kitasatospora azatica]|uniref:DUF6049 family protein n=1 Tax=Kitasatospora azatica TaxID=58347 RepID=UPI0012F81816|nr:DUF6049 family protein [Kitasatospora azatica]
MGEPARHTEVPHRSCPVAPRPGRTRRLSVLIASTLALLGVTTVAPQATAAPGFAAVSPDFPVAITINSVKPAAPGSGDSLQVSGTVTNTGAAALKGASVDLSLGRYRQPLPTRSEIADRLAKTDPTSADGTPLSAPVSQLGDLAAGASQPFSLPAVPMSELKLEKNGVYELAVEVSAGTPDEETAHPVGIARTLLPYFGDANGVKPTKVATLWPLTHAPELVAQTGPESEQTPVLRDDSLAAELATTGRLGALVDLGSKMQSLTWVIDPDLLDAVFAMTKQYRVQVPGHGGDPVRDGNTVAGTNQAVATAWLNKLRQAVTANGAEVVALPYADPDLASIAHNGNGVAGLDTALGKARQAGRLTVEGRLSVDVKDNTAWPYQGYLDQQTAQVTQQLGAGQILVNSASVPDQPSLNYTPNAARRLADGQTAVVADGTIASLLQSDLTTDDSRAQAQQRLLAETLAVTLQKPAQQRTLLVMPPRSLTAATAGVLQSSLAQAGKWIEPATLDTVAGTPADPLAGTAIAGAEAYPSDLRGSELPQDTFSTVAGMQKDVDLMLRILTLPARVSSPFSAALARSVSTEWRGNQAAGATYLRNARSYLNQLMGAVNIPAKSHKITLAGDSGLIQVSVRNDLTQPVINLELQLSSAQPNRLRVTTRHPIDQLAAGQSASPRFQAQAVGNGPVQMTAQLYTVGPDPQKYGDPVVFVVEVSQVPSGVWWVVGAGGLLVLAAGLRIFLHRRKRAGEPPEDPDAPLVDPDAAAAEPEAEPATDIRPKAPDQRETDLTGAAGEAAAHP